MVQDSAIHLDTYLSPSVITVKHVSEVLILKMNLFPALWSSGFSSGCLSLALARCGTGGRTRRTHGAREAAAACIGLCGQLWTETRSVAVLVLYPMAECLQLMETSELGPRSWSALKDVLSAADVRPRIHSDHHDFRGGGAACGHDSHSGGESTLNAEWNSQDVLMLIGFSSPAHE